MASDTVATGGLLLGVPEAMNMLLTEVVGGFKFSAYLRLSAHTMDFRKTRVMKVTCGLIIKYPPKLAHMVTPPMLTYYVLLL